MEDDLWNFFNSLVPNQSPLEFDKNVFEQMIGIPPSVMFETELKTKEQKPGSSSHPVKTTQSPNSSWTELSRPSSDQDISTLHPCSAHIPGKQLGHVTLTNEPLMTLDGDEFMPHTSSSRPLDLQERRGIVNTALTSKPSTFPTGTLSHDGPNLNGFTPQLGLGNCSKTVTEALHGEYDDRITAFLNFINHQNSRYTQPVATNTQVTASPSTYDIPIPSLDIGSAANQLTVTNHEDSEGSEVWDNEMSNFTGELLPFRELKTFTKGRDSKTPWTEDEIKAARSILAFKQQEWGAESNEVEYVLSSAYAQSNSRLRLRRKALKQAFKSCKQLKNRRPDVVCKTLLTGCFTKGTKFKVTKELGERIQQKFADHIKFKAWTDICKRIQSDEDFSQAEREGLAAKERGPERLRTFYNPRGRGR